MRILIVDDEFVSRKKAMKILAEFGDCDVAFTGEEALEAYKLAYDECEPYTLVTLDIMMPGWDGVETLRRIREFEQSRNVRLGMGAHVIMLTAHKTARNVVTCFHEGCEAYVVKPFDRDKLVKALTEMNLYSCGGDFDE